MTTEVAPRQSSHVYSAIDKRLCKAAVERYGARTAERVLRSSIDHVPAMSSLKAWAASPNIVVTEADEQFWVAVERRRSAGLRAEIAERLAAPKPAVKTNPSRERAISQGIVAREPSVVAPS